MKHISDDDLIDYLHNEASDAVDADIHAHLGHCRECGDRYDAEAGLSERLRSAARADEREFPAIVRANVWAAIRSAEPSPLERLRAFLRPVFAVPVAVALLLGAFLGVPVLRSGHPDSPTVAAAYYFEEHAADALESPLGDHAAGNAPLAFAHPPAGLNAPLVDAAQAATLDDDISSRE